MLGSSSERHRLWCDDNSVLISTANRLDHDMIRWRLIHREGVFDHAKTDASRATSVTQLASGSQRRR